MKDVKWIEGAPEKIEPGMLVLVRDVEYEGVWLAGSGIDPDSEIAWVMANCVAWAWLIQPHELEWVERMARAHMAGEQGKAV